MKLSIDFMEGEIRGREKEEIIKIDKLMIQDRWFTSIPIADKQVRLPVPSYTDYFIMKVVSARPSDIRDIASLIVTNGIPEGLKQRIKEILPYPEIFERKLCTKIIAEIKKKSFLDSWKGIFATTSYTEADKMKVIKMLERILASI